MLSLMNKMLGKQVESELENGEPTKNLDNIHFKMANSACHNRACDDTLCLAHHVIIQFSHCA